MGPDETAITISGALEFFYGNGTIGPKLFTFFECRSAPVPLGVGLGSGSRLSRVCRCLASPAPIQNLGILCYKRRLDDTRISGGKRPRIACTRI